MKVKVFGSCAVVIGFFLMGITGCGNLEEPYGIAIYEDDVFITDVAKHCVFRFSREGKLLAKWGREGSAKGEFSYPCGIAVDEKGNIFVADTDNRRIQQFDRDGILYHTFGAEGYANGCFIKPFAVDAIHGWLVVADIGRGDIQMFFYGSGSSQYRDKSPKNRIEGFVDLAGYIDYPSTKDDDEAACMLEAIVHPQGKVDDWRDGQLFTPTDVVLDGTTKMLVADSGDNAIFQVSMEDFALNWAFPLPGDNPSWYWHGVKRIALCPPPSSLIYVLSEKAISGTGEKGKFAINHINKFDASLKQIYERWNHTDWAIEGVPRDIAVDDDGNVYITTREGVTKFNSDGIELKKWY